MKYIHQGYILTVFQYSFNVVNFSNHINIQSYMLVILCGPFRNAKCRFQFIVREPEIGVKMHLQHTFAEFEYFSFQLQWNKFVQWDQVFTITPISEEVCVPKFGSLET